MLTGCRNIRRGRYNLGPRPCDVVLVESYHKTSHVIPHLLLHPPSEVQPLAHPHRAPCSPCFSHCSFCLNTSSHLIFALNPCKKKQPSNNIPFIIVKQNGFFHFSSIFIFCHLCNNLFFFLLTIHFHVSFRSGGG